MKLVESSIVKKVRTTEVRSKLLNGWWVLFLQRWPVVSLRKGDLFAVVREETTKFL